MTSHVAEESFIEEWKEWHRQHELRRARRHGFLSITALHWLTDVPQRFNDVPGSWAVANGDVRVKLSDDETLEIDGARITGDFVFANVHERGYEAKCNDVLIEVSRRDGQFMIRPRDPDNVVRTGYLGTPTYPPNSRWVANGTFIAFDAPRLVEVGASAEGLTHVFESSGEIEFELEQTTMRLTTFNDDEPGELFIVFADLTSGSTTYASCRFLSVKSPGADGRVLVDFNRATNPPCAYTDFATCPLPPANNHLTVRIEAGERLPTGVR